MDDFEKRLVEYLKEEYQPEAILLAGSRVEGQWREGSDWDIFLIGAKKGRDGVVEWQNQLLDITSKDLPNGDRFLTTPFGPLFPTKVLWDGTGGALAGVLGLTEQAFHRGPLDLYADAVQARKERLISWLGKVKGAEIEEVRFFYAGELYEYAMRLWFELRNKWPVAPKIAWGILVDEDPAFAKLLSEFANSSGVARVGIAEGVVARLVE